LDPVIEVIAKQIKTRLESVQVANGYQTTVADVQRPTRINAVAPLPNRVVFAQDDASDVEDLDGQGRPPSRAFAHGFIVGMFIMPAQTSTDPIETAINRACADLCNAVMADPQWTGLAIDTRVTNPGTWEIHGNGDYALAEIGFAVTYRVAENDHYANRA